MGNGRRGRNQSPEVELRCPQCRKKTAWGNNPYRPFCSFRCRSLDLGAWVEEEYRVPGESAKDTESSEE